ncbi:MAG: hypothetical protein ACI36X_00885 [Bacteroidaceae bacterium]
MKKNLLFAAALMASVCASAQGVWKAADYITEKGLAADAQALTEGQEITSVPGITFTAAQITADGTGWLAKPDAEAGTFEFNGETYGKGYVQGTVNGATIGDPKIPSLNKAATLDAARAEFRPTVDGSLDVAFKAGWNKQFWVIETTQEFLEGDAFDGTFAAEWGYNAGQYWGGYWSTDVDAATWGTFLAEVPAAQPTNENAFMGCTLNVKAGKVYIVLATGSKLMLCGYKFTPGEGDAISTVEAAEVVAESYFTTNGVEMAQPVKGVNIVKQTLANGNVKVVKVVK